MHDVALHLLDGNLRSLSMLRDGYFAGPGPASPALADVVGYLNQLNRDWVAATQRLSPLVVLDLLAYSGPAYYKLLASLDPLAPATFAVAWAGEQTSPNWLHIAREYTEKWHHQQQIRQAVGQQAPLYRPTLYHPYLQTSVRALPPRLASVPAASGQAVLFEVGGPGGGRWLLRRGPDAWQMTEVEGETLVAEPVRAHVKIAGPVAWRLFSKNISLAEAALSVTLKGDEQLGRWLLGTVAVMA